MPKFILQLAGAATAVMILVVLTGAGSNVSAQTQPSGASTTQASSTPAQPPTASAPTCADFDSWCKYCAGHPVISLCASYAPGNGVASATGGVDPSDPDSDGAGGGDGGGY